ncbi:MAG: hypothetical protein AAF740_13790, partial [Bacteroidota bacterium]
MKNVFVINGHQYYPFAEGKLNKTFVEKAKEMLGEADFEIKTTLLQRNKNRHEKVKINSDKNQLSVSCLSLKIYINQEIGKPTMNHSV